MSKHNASKPVIINKAIKPASTVSVGSPAASTPTPAPAPQAAPQPAPVATLAPTPAATPAPAKPDTMLHKSAVASPVKAVWALCEQMVGAKRGDVVKAAVAQGIATHTARTQYQRWFASKKAPAATTTVTPAASEPATK